MERAISLRPRIHPLDAARLSMLVTEGRMRQIRADGRPWSQEDLAEKLGDEMGRDISRHEAGWLESSPPRPLGRSHHRELWAAAVSVLGLDRAVVNKLCGGV